MGECSARKRPGVGHSTAAAAYIIGMTIFDENEHPRGQSDNAGQFRDKDNSVPDAGLPDRSAASLRLIAAEARADAAGNAEFRAHRESHLANVELLCATLLDEFPTAAAARFERDYGDDEFSMTGVVDASGAEIPGAVETSEADEIMGQFGAEAFEYFEREQVPGGEAVVLNLIAG